MGVIENRIDILELERSGGGGGGGTAASVSYDNTSSGLSATTVQGAIDELAGDITDPAADDVTYDNTTSGLSATDVQGAVDQLASGLSNANSLISGIDNKANSLSNQLSDDGTAAGTKFYFDEQGGVYGFNTSAARGADTFHPFNSGGKTLYLWFYATSDQSSQIQWISELSDTLTTVDTWAANETTIKTIPNVATVQRRAARALAITALKPIRVYNVGSSDCSTSGAGGINLSMGEYVDMEANETITPSPSASKQICCLAIVEL